MTTESHAPNESAPARRTFRRVATAAVVGGAILLAGFGVAAAQTDDTPPSTDPPAAEGRAPAAKAPGDGPRGGEGMRGGKPGGGGGGGGRHGGPMGHAIHGSFVVPDGDGFRTREVQTGTVTAVSASSITVRSADGFTRTYVVDDNTIVNAGRDGIADVKQDDTVRLDAVVEGDAAKARHIHDITTNQAIRRQVNPNAPAPAPAPAA